MSGPVLPSSSLEFDQVLVYADASSVRMQCWHCRDRVLVLLDEQDAEVHVERFLRVHPASCLPRPRDSSDPVVSP